MPRSRRIAQAILQLAALACFCLLARAVPAGAADASTLLLLLMTDGEFVAPALDELELVTDKDFVTVPEGGAATFRLKLSRPPDGALGVDVAVVSGAVSQVALAQGSAHFDFNPDDWSTWRTVTVAGSADQDQADALTGIVLSAGQLTATVTALHADAERNAAAGSHVGKVGSYAGPGTCLGCHGDKAAGIESSTHFLWQGTSYPHIAGSTAGEKLGKWGGINDFCTYPNLSWLSRLTTADGRQVDGGCGKCHIGLGAKPDSGATASGADCLLCHAPDYKRKLSDNGQGGYAFVADTANMRLGLDDTARNIIRPGKSQCLQCHAKSGGGNNAKRGDIEEFHRVPTAAFDVHMASAADGGLGFDCTRCHTVTDHHVAGRGVDLPGRDAAATMECGASGCHATHAAKGVANASYLDRHVKRVDCSTCHIPTFAKLTATDMDRDYSAPATIVPSSLLREPHIVKGRNVRPVYRFFNGTSDYYRFGTGIDAAAIDPATGRVIMAGPRGAVTDAGAKIRPFKLHTGKMAYEPVGQRLIGLKMGVLFGTGDVDKAIRDGAAEKGFDVSGGYGFAQVERFLGISHGVAPAGASTTLHCGDCHASMGAGGRLDFAALGYTPTRPRAYGCWGSCHTSDHQEAGSEIFSKSFKSFHNTHVRDENLDCATCHGFSKAI